VALIPKGETQRITSSEIGKATNLSGAEIRKIVNDSRSKFIPIASDGNGYFIATEPAELNHTIAQLNSRIHKMIKAREGLKKAQKNKC
jgi:hypothetical protein